MVQFTRRWFVLAAVLTTAAALAHAVAQPPPPPSAPALLPPSVTGTLPSLSTNSVRPASGPDSVGNVRPRTPADAPINRFDELSAYPGSTQAAVKSFLQGAAWLTRMNQPQGRFLHGYLPAVRLVMDGGDEVKQAHAAHALAEAARYTGDPRQSAVAGQAVLALLAATRVDPADASARVPSHPPAACDRVRFAAVLALAVYALPATDERLVTEAERLCGFLRAQLRADGSVSVGGVAADADEDESAGYVFQALAAANRAKPVAWKAEALERGLAHYRKRFQARPTAATAASLTPAFADWYLQAKNPIAAAFVFEMTDWLAALQYPPTDLSRPTWVGGFRSYADGKPVDAVPGFESGRCVESLAWAVLVTRHVPDAERFAKYKQAAVDGVQFLCGLQYTEANTRHFENNFRAGTLIGGYYLSPTDGNLRVDATAHCLNAMCRFLQSGAEKE